MSEKRFEKDCDENVCSFDYSTMDTYYEYNVSNEEIIEWNKHSSNAEYTDFERIAEILNIKQMRLESLMKHREEVGKLFDKIDEQQDTICKLQDLCGESDSENAKLRIENKKLKAKLKEKEEDEQLYANEILELRKTNEEWLQFKDLGGDY